MFKLIISFLFKRLSKKKSVSNLISIIGEIRSYRCCLLAASVSAYRHDDACWFPWYTSYRSNLQRSFPFQSVRSLRNIPLPIIVPNVRLRLNSNSRGHQQVTQINRFIYVSVQRMYRIRKRFILDSVKSVRLRKKLSPYFKRYQNTGGDSIYVWVPNCTRYLIHRH